VDLLGLGMMAVLEEAIQIVNQASGPRPQASENQVEVQGDRPQSSRDLLRPEARGQRPAGIDLAHLPPNDPVVYRMLQQADTSAVSQVGSRAEMATLPRLKPEHFYDPAVGVAIIRPGPIVGNMVHPYLARRRGDEPVTYPHPLLEPVLKRTLGVP